MRAKMRADIYRRLHSGAVRECRKAYLIHLALERRLVQQPVDGARARRDLALVRLVKLVGERERKDRTRAPQRVALKCSAVCV